MPLMYGGIGNTRNVKSNSFNQCITGFLKANINTPEIEKFIPEQDNGDALCEAIAAAIESAPIVAFIRPYEVRFQEQHK